MAKTSAGLLMYRFQNKKLQVFLVHLGGPFFKKSDIWMIPKGEQQDGEDLLATAKREFGEETNIVLKSDYQYINLGAVTQKNNKIIYVWAFENGTFDPAKLKSNLTEFGWPEVDKGDYFNIDEAARIIFPAQKPFLERITKRLAVRD